MFIVSIWLSLLMSVEKMKSTMFLLMLILVLMSSATIATNPNKDEDALSSNKDTIEFSAFSSNPLNYKECDYSSDALVLNCSNIHPNLNALPNMNIIIHIFDISNASLTEMLLLSQYKLFTRMKILNASKNNIKVLSEVTFKGLKYLEKINLSHNKLTKLPNNIFAELGELRFLDISNNFLLTLPSILPMLEWFDVSSNQISTLSETFSSILYPQRIVLIARNPFICDCKIFWLKEWLNTRMYLTKYVTHISIDKFIPTCIQPDHLQGKRWDLIDDSEFKCMDYENEEELGNVNSVYKTEMDIKVSVEDISSQSVVIKWTDYSMHNTKSIEIRSHKFGNNKEVHKTILPLTAGSYRLKNMEENTPYIICFSILPESTVNLDCEEIVTTKALEKSSSLFLVEKVFCYISENIYRIILLFVIVYVTVILLSNINYNHDNKSEDDS